MARAATTGGGRTAGAKRPMGWYSVMAVVALMGVFLVAFSRNQEQSKVARASSTPPRLNKDHWHAAFSVYLCDHFATNIPQFESPDGMHTHGDGVIHLHPFTPKASGNNATLGVYASSVTSDLKSGPFKLSSTELQFPGDKKDWKNGDQCQGKPGKVKLTVNGKELTQDPATYIVKNGDLIDVGFVPTATPLPANPAEKKNLAAINDVPTSTGTTTPTTAAGTPTTVAGTTATTAADTATTTPGSTQTTGAPATTAAPTSPSTSTP
ncbi:MAG: hypothetical protein NVS1B12_15230 [Acidimicrobiales bacterium]